MCWLIFFGTCDIFQDSLRNKKLKRTVFIQNRNFVIQYTLFKSFGSVNVFFLFFLLINTFIQQGCVKLIKSDSKDLNC